MKNIASFAVPSERSEGMKEGMKEIISPPSQGTCLRSLLAAFWQGICVVTETEEELNALRQAIREERRRGNPRPNGHELLKEIRARKPPTKQ